MQNFVIERSLLSTFQRDIYVLSSRRICCGDGSFCLAPAAGSRLLQVVLQRRLRFADMFLLIVIITTVVIFTFLTLKKKNTIVRTVCHKIY